MSMTAEQIKLIMLAGSQVFYAASVVLSLFIIDTGRREWVPYLAGLILIGLLGFTAAGYIAYPTAIVAMISYTLVATVYSALSESWKRQVRYGGMLLGLLAGFHQVHGITTVPLYSKWWEYGSRLLAFDFPLDKAFAGLLLALIAAQFHPQKRDWRYIWLVPGGVALIIAAVMLLGHSMQLTIPEYAAAFVFVNLMETCFAEELFFRGALQRELMLYLAPVPAIVITAFLSGLVHIHRGWEFFLMASAAGVLHGFVYRRTGVLSLSVISHFLVNVAWMFLFPSLGR